ncbi:MAG TPA: hypothetical protein VKM54_26690 [Myxococcota bacterium]|nr:hypothetical protein [Myxococcota bacterium]
MANPSRQHSVKGTLVLGAVVTVRRLRDRGRISPEQLAARLGAAALALIDEKIDIGRWYPLDAFCEILDTDWDVGGHRDPDYMREEGTRAADRLFESGIYQQLQFAERSERAQAADKLIRRTKLITTITGSLFNFLMADVRLNPDQRNSLEILYSNATGFSEALRYTTEGFMNQINKRQGSSKRWSSNRLRPDLVVFTLPLPRRLTEGS